VPSPNDHRYDAMVPSLSVLSAAEKLTVRGAAPEVALVATATAAGATFALDVTVTAELVVLSPTLSVTRTVTLNVPTVLNTWLVVTPVAVFPSPNDHRYDAMVPSLSVLPAAEKLTVRGATPEVALVAAATAVGGVPDVTTTTAELVVLSPTLSVTRTVTLKLPTVPNT
jgi:hypothetical protein